MRKNLPDHLHLGCGLTTPGGWVNVDGSWQVVLARYPWIKSLLVSVRILPRKQAAIPWSPEVVRWDLAKPLPYANNYFAAIYSSHALEHLYHDDALSLLKECYRVLKPGGVCRIVVPDLGAIMDRYRRAKDAKDADAATKLMEELMVHDKKPKTGILGMFYRVTAFHQHKWMYDSDSLARLFELAGFAEVRTADFLDSRIERISDVENEGRIADGQGIVVEGMKPPLLNR
jgi:predicted SAM-dependent methyltransferase